MTKQESMLAMLEDVVAHFSKDPDNLRSVSGYNNCKYYPPKDLPKSIGCGIGIYLPWDVAAKLDRCTNSSINNVMGKYRKLLPMWMQKLPTRFLSHIQRLHDTHNCWDSRGLTLTGKNWVKNMEKKIKSSYYTVNSEC